MGQRINAIVVRPYAPTTAVFNRVPVLAKIAGAIHRTTNQSVIRRFLLLREGDRCIELRRAESERILRAQPFIAYAIVRALADTGGGVVLDVRTTDELAIVVGVAAGKGTPVVRLLRLGDANVAGEGVYLAGDWRDGGAYRDGYGGTLIDNQLFGRPYTLVAQGHQYPLGDDWGLDALHP